MARRKSDYEGFAKFARENSDLSEQQIIDKYKAETPYGGRKQNLLAIIRQEYGLEKGKKRNKKVQEKANTSKAVPYRKPKKVKGIKGHGTKNLKLTKKQTLDLASPAVGKFAANLVRLYGNDSKSLVRVNVQITGDIYTKGRVFSVYYPHNGRDLQGAKQTGNNIIDSLITYYDNLAKMYEKKGGLQGRMIPKIEKLKKQLQDSRNMDIEDIKTLFAKNGIKIKGFELMNLE